MPDAKPRLVGVELYFEDLETAKRFYRDTLGLKLLDEKPSHHAKFDGAGEFVCLEWKRSEPYPYS